MNKPGDAQPHRRHMGLPGPRAGPCSCDHRLTAVWGGSAFPGVPWVSASNSLPPNACMQGHPEHPHTGAMPPWLLPCTWAGPTGGTGAANQHLELCARSQPSSRVRGQPGWHGMGKMGPKLPGPSAPQLSCTRVTCSATGCPRKASPPGTPSPPNHSCSLTQANADTGFYF